MFQEIAANVRAKTPLIHNITNYVTVNDCANILLACGGSPIMADDIGEAEEITALCSGLNLNIGTLNQRTIPAMLAAGRRAKELGHPVVLDPVGAGASALRTSTALRLLEEVRPTVIRGNISEIKTLALGSGKWYMIRTILLPSAMPGIITGVILAIGRMVGESAALLFTAGSGFILPKNFFGKIFESGGTLTIQLYLCMQKAQYDEAFGIAVVLLVIVLAINGLAKYLACRFNVEK